MAGSLLVYVGGLIHSITLGLGLVGAAILVMLVVLLRKLRGAKDGVRENGAAQELGISYIFERYCLVDGTYFVIICLGCMWLANRHGANLYYFDEFSHWGQMTKELLRLDGFYTTSASTLMRHNEYPPIIPLWEAICCRLAGGFDGRFMYAALWTLQFSMLLPFVDCANNHKKVFTLTSLVRLIALVLFALLFINAFDAETGGFFASLYADVAMAILGGVVLYETFTMPNRLFEWASLAIKLAFLLLIKEASLFFVGLAMLVLFVRLVLSKSFRKPTNAGVKSAWIAFALLALSCLVTYLSWKLVVHFADFDKSTIQFGATSSGVLAILVGNLSDLQRELMHNYFAALRSTDIYPYLPIRVSYVRGVTVVLIVSLVLGILSKKKAKDIVALLALELGSSALYVVFMLLMYFTGFSEWEMQTLASFNRYMNTFLTSLFIFAFFYFLNGMLFVSPGQHAAQSSEGLSSHLDSALLVVSTLGLAAILVLSPNALVYVTDEQTSAATQIQRSKAEYLTSELPEGANLFLVNQGQSLDNLVAIDYYADGIKFTPGCYRNINYSTSTSNYSVDEWTKNASTADYFFISVENEEFLNTFGQRLSIQPEVGALYKVEGTTNDIIQLGYVSSWSE